MQSAVRFQNMCHFHDWPQQRGRREIGSIEIKFHYYHVYTWCSSSMAEVDIPDSGV